MKKLVLLLLSLPFIAFAQITPGRYKINLATYNLNMELAPSTTIIKVSQDCRDRMPNCGAQVWQIVPFFRVPNAYFLQLVSTREYLTWRLEEPNKLPTLKLRASNSNINSQAFKIIANDKGSYQIQPYTLDNISNDYYLGAETAAGAYGYVRLFKSNEISSGMNSNSWKFNPPVTPLPAQTGSRVVVTPPQPRQSSTAVVVVPPSANRLEIDIKTGGDNLEPKNPQENPEVVIKLRGKPSIVKTNINDGREWPNNSIKRVIVPLPSDLKADDIEGITINRRKIGIDRVWQLGEKDNWNMDKIQSTLKIMENGVLKTYRAPEMYSPLGFSNPLFRFVYEGGDNRAEGQIFTAGLYFGNHGGNAPNPIRNTSAPTIFKIETLTGGDDLRGGNDNLNVLIRLKIRPVRNIALNNINNRQSWGNFTEHTVTRPITGQPFTFDDIEDIILRHTGGAFGQGIDNWYLDKLKITLTIGGETRILVDQVAAPIHYFKGDSRSKTFPINQ